MWSRSHKYSVILSEGAFHYLMKYLKVSPHHLFCLSRCHFSWPLISVNSLLYEEIVLSALMLSVLWLLCVGSDSYCPLWTPVAPCGLAREHCRISPSRFLPECHKKRLNQVSFVLLCFALFACFFWVVFSFCSVSIFWFVFCPIFSSIYRPWMALYSLIVLMCR